MYIKPLSFIIDSHTIMHNSFADYFQLHMSNPDKISKFIQPMLSCISDIKAWVTVNMLKFNDKSELMLVTSKRTKHLHSFTIGNAQIPFKQSLKNFGFALHCHVTLNEHAFIIARTMSSGIYCSFLTSTATTTYASDFLPWIVYCKSLFCPTRDVTSCLQRMQYYAMVYIAWYIL